MFCSLVTPGVRPHPRSSTWNVTPLVAFQETPRSTLVSPLNWSCFDSHHLPWTGLTWRTHMATHTGGSRTLHIFTWLLAVTFSERTDPGRARSLHHRKTHLHSHVADERHNFFLMPFSLSPLEFPNFPFRNPPVAQVTQSGLWSDCAPYPKTLMARKESA